MCTTFCMRPDSVTIHKAHFASLYDGRLVFKQEPMSVCVDSAHISMCVVQKLSLVDANVLLNPYMNQ